MYRCYAENSREDQMGANGIRNTVGRMKGDEMSWKGTRRADPRWRRKETYGRT